MRLVQPCAVQEMQLSTLRRHLPLKAPQEHATVSGQLFLASSVGNQDVGAVRLVEVFEIGE
jgi:hypothetical protein